MTRMRATVDWAIYAATGLVLQPRRRVRAVDGGGWQIPIS